ncbi:MAG: molybdopterin-dependent oxidoreductase [Pseudomonadota bacterium]
MRNTSILLVIGCLFAIFALTNCFAAVLSTLSIKGAVEHPQELTLSDFQAMPSFFLKDVYQVEEKTAADQKDKLISAASYRGVLLRDLLLKAQMKFKRKWEPGVFIRVKNNEGNETVFSFGEIFYSSIGRSILLAYEKNESTIPFQNGCAELIVATDVRAGRRVTNVTEITVDRVNVEMQAYDDKKKQIQRPPTNDFTLIDHLSNRSQKMGLSDLKRLPGTFIPAAVMAGDCEGFRGIYSFKGTTLKEVLTLFGIKYPPTDYNRYVLIASEDGFCTTFSMGELFNSRLSDNIVIAYEKDEKVLNGNEGFAMSVVREDSMGGRSVKRIYRIELF